MNINQYASKFCSNYHGGRCLGIWICDDGTLTRFAKPQKCWLPGKCQYLEQSVAPGAKTLPQGRLRDESLAAVKEYRLGVSVETGPSGG